MPAAVGLVLAGALGLRLIGLHRHELWFDEAFAALLALEPVPVILGELANDSSPPLYFVLLRGWALLFGPNAEALRLFSVLAGLASIVGVVVLGRLFWSERAGLAAGALLAVSPLHVYYSREVRPYSLLLTFVLLSFVALEKLGRAERRRARIPWCAYCVATLAAVYTHNYGWLLIPVLLLWVVLGKVRARSAFVALAVVTACYLPWLPVLAGQVNSDATAWVEIIWEQTPPAWALVKSAAAFSVGGRTPEYVQLATHQLPPFISGASYTLFAVLIAIALWRDRSGRARQAGVSILLLLVPPVALSFVEPMYVVGRHDVVALPLFLLMAACGLTQLGRPAESVAKALLVVLASTALMVHYRQPVADYTRRQASLLLEHAEPSDRVLCTGFTRNTVEYYLRVGGGTQPTHSFPPSLERHRGWVDQRELEDQTLLAAEARRLAESLRHALRRDGMLWIVHSRGLAPANELLMRQIGQSLRQVRCPADAEKTGLTCWRSRDA